MNLLRYACYCVLLLYIWLFFDLFAETNKNKDCFVSSSCSYTRKISKSLRLTRVSKGFVNPKTSVAPGRPSMLCLRFCFVLCRPWFPIFNPCYVINFKLEFLRPDRTKCLETWYHYCILPNLKNSLLQFLEKMSLLEDACLGLDFPFLALAMI